jgi:dTDP-4-dehydrorhamnose 3,5-epimerase
MNIVATAIPDVHVIEPRVFRDDRGFFLESYNQRTLANMGIRAQFVQDNLSQSRKYVLRGLHYQIQQPQAKLIRVVHGDVYDVAVDLRKASPTFGKWVGERLTAENQRQVFIPEGFAHGFLVLSDVAVVLYKTTDFYAPAAERTICWDDADLAIDWPLAGRQPILSAKDAQAPRLRDAETF